MKPFGYTPSTVVNSVGETYTIKDDKKLLWFALGFATVTIGINIYLHHQLKKEQQWRTFNTTT